MKPLEHAATVPPGADNNGPGRASQVPRLCACKSGFQISVVDAFRGRGDCFRPRVES
jgi:hypothetical protein